MLLTEIQGVAMVKFARQIIKGHFMGDAPKPHSCLKDVLNEKRGVFVTLHESNSLRGCIGYPYDSHKLKDALNDAALSSAFRDPRFPPLKVTELERIVVEVSILTPPKLLVVSDPIFYSKQIKIGRDGLIAKRGHASGLLLPQVPVEQKWGADEFLEHTCMKAGLMNNAYLKPGFELYKFEAQIFTEIEPRGKISSRKIK